MQLPEIKVDTKIVVALALLTLAVSYVVYLENKKLKNAIDTPNKKPCRCNENTITEVAKASAEMSSPPTVVTD